MWTRFVACLLVTAAPVSANAAELIFSYTGTINSAVQLSGGTDLLGAGATIKNGDAVTAQFAFDPDAAVLGGCLPLGGGFTCSYNAVLTNYSLAVGNYIKSYSQLLVNFYIQNDVFGQDALGVAYTESGSGPFNSNLTGLQFQGRYSGNALSSTNLSSSIPLAAADWSIFASFSGATGRVDFRGPLALQIHAGSGVPEPSTWAILLIGFGFLGSEMRSTKRRQKFAVSYA